jgi:hypothetical protein
MGFFATKRDEKQATVTSVIPEIEPAPAPQPPTSQVRALEAAPKPGPRVGIDHAIQLIRSLPTDRNVDLVVTVLKTTLESLGIRISDIVADASQRQKDLDARVSQLKSEIGALEQEIQRRAEEIVRLEAAHAETTKVRDYLEAEEIQLMPDESRETRVAEPPIP